VTHRQWPTVSLRRRPFQVPGPPPEAEDTSRPIVLPERCAPEADPVARLSEQTESLLYLMVEFRRLLYHVLVGIAIGAVLAVLVLFALLYE
jgi:hypothetical protein